MTNNFALFKYGADTSLSPAPNESLEGIVENPVYDPKELVLKFKLRDDLRSRNFCIMNPPEILKHGAKVEVYYEERDAYFEVLGYHELEKGKKISNVSTNANYKFLAWNTS